MRSSNRRFSKNAPALLSPPSNQINYNLSNTMKKFSIVLILLLLAGLTGCASPARVEQMVAKTPPAQRIASTPMRSNIAVRDVSGGKETNPMWVSNVGNSEFEQALEASLREAGLLSGGKQLGKYTLVAHMEKVDQPFAGLDMTVTVTVNYILIERASGKEVMNKRIAVPFTATFSDAFSGVERLRVANEGAIRMNIGKLIESILAVGVDAVALK